VLGFPFRACSREDGAGRPHPLTTGPPGAGRRPRSLPLGGHAPAWPCASAPRSRPDAPTLAADMDGSHTSHPRRPARGGDGAPSKATRRTVASAASPGRHGRKAAPAPPAGGPSALIDMVAALDHNSAARGTATASMKASFGAGAVALLRRDAFGLARAHHGPPWAGGPPGPRIRQPGLGETLMGKLGGALGTARPGGPCQHVADGARFEERVFTNGAGSRPYKLYVPSSYAGPAAPARGHAAWLHAVAR
jgi:hypothetical protein